MAVTNDSSYDRPQSVLFQKIERLGIARVPGRFQVDEHMDLATVRRVLNAQRILVTDGQRLLHHYVYAQCGTLLNHSSVLTRGSKDQHCPRMRLQDHFLNAAEVQACRQMMAL